MSDLLEGYAGLVSMLVGFNQIDPDSARQHARRIVNAAMAAPTLSPDAIVEVSQLTNLVPEADRAAFNAKFL
jgi:hypothetical protein